MLTDVTRLEQVKELIEAASSYEGHLDFVFNNAGMGMTLPTEQITFDTWRFIVDLNLMGVVHGTYTAIPIMRKQGFGHIVNTGSVAGLFPAPYQALYAATKGAVIRMTESLQYELEADGINFSVFCPGNVRTAIFGGLTPPADSISVDEAVEYVFGELEKKEMVIILPENSGNFTPFSGRTGRNSTGWPGRSPLSDGRTTAPGEHTIKGNMYGIPLSPDCRGPDGSPAVFPTEKPLNCRPGLFFLH